MKIRSIQNKDLELVAQLRHQLWPEDIEEDRRELNRYFDGFKKHICEIYLLENDDYEICGFIELNTRAMIDYSEQPVAFIEGWFVSEKYRDQGFGKLLMEKAEEWAKQKGFKEIYSDTEISNERSINVHKSLGFKEIVRTVDFVKNLEE